MITHIYRHSNILQGVRFHDVNLFTLKEGYRVIEKQYFSTMTVFTDSAKRWKQGYFPSKAEASIQLCYIIVPDLYFQEFEMKQFIAFIDSTSEYYIGLGTNRS